MLFDIYQGNVKLISTRLEGKQTKKLPFENVVDINLTLPGYVDFQIGNTINVYGEWYLLRDVPSVTRPEDRHLEYDYNLHFESIDSLLSDALFANYDANNNLTIFDFALMGNAESIIDLVIVNAARLGIVWTKGVIDDTPYRLRSYSAQNCLNVLAELSQDHELDLWFNGGTINLSKRGGYSGLTLQHGYNKGLYSIERTKIDNKNRFTRLYAFGSEKNISGTYRGGSRRLKLPVTVGDFIEVNIGPNEQLIEKHQYFDDIFPHRTGTITSTTNELVFTDSTIDFNVNDYKLPGQPAKIIFKTGQLAGYEFDVDKFNNATKTFTIIVNKEEKAIVMPSPDIKAHPGDQYIVINIFMPPTHTSAAEDELYIAANDLLQEGSIPAVQYNVVPDPLYFKRQNISLGISDFVNIKDTEIGIDKNIRVTGYVRDLNNQYKYDSIELADSVIGNVAVKQFIDKANIQKAIAMNRLNDVNRARLSWRNSQELLNLVVDPEGNYFTEKIKPLSIETSMLAVGPKSQQFVLSDVVFSPNYLADANKFNSTAGALLHYSIESAVRVWSISAISLLGLDPAKPYYIYAKCAKVGAAGTIVLSETAIVVDSVPDYYHFLVGALHSVIDSVRGISLTYGQTTINGKFIKTGTIYSQDGQTYFNLDTGELVGNFKFSDGNNVRSMVDAAHSASTAAATAANNAYNQAIAAGEAAIEALDNAVEALEAATDAQTDATAALEALEVIGSDNVLSATEKPSVLKEWQIIQGERPTIIAQALNYSVNTASYTTAYSSLNGYITPLLTDLTANTAIAGPTFRLTFKNYYDEKVALLKAVSDAAKVLSDNAASAASTAQLAANAANSAATAANSAAAAAQVTATNAATAANNAENAANNAQTDATAALSMLGAVGSDDVLSAGEKPAVLKEWQIIQGEKLVIIPQAATYGVSSIAYTNSYNALDVYISPLVADLTTNTAISGVTFRATFQTYYDAKVALLKSVSDSAKVLADNAAAAAASAASAAATANGTANTAYTQALSAISAANTALTDAYNAQVAANAAASAASAAQASANNAQSSANTALSALANIASDSVLSAGEKPAVLKEWQIVVAEQSILIAQAGTYSISTSSLTSNYNALSSYISPLLSSLTTDSVIDGPTFRTYWQAYYDSKVSLLKAVSDAAKTAANTAQSAANAAQSTADTAQSTANTAVSAAATAQATANTAATAAYNAALDAAQALSVANNAKLITDYFSTTINGPVIGTGAVLVGSGSFNNAGIVGTTDAGAGSVRFFAGAAYADRYTAPFRVLDNGDFFSSNATIQGNITAGSIGGFIINTNMIQGDGGAFGGAVGDSYGVLEMVNGHDPYLQITRRVVVDPSFTATLFGSLITPDGGEFQSLTVRNTATFQGDISFDPTVVKMQKFNSVSLGNVNYTCTDSDYFVAMNASGKSITLPSLHWDCRRILIKNLGTGTLAPIAINGNGATVSGSASVAASAYGEYLWVEALGYWLRV